jgi:hypothetical protein
MEFCDLAVPVAPAPETHAEDDVRHIIIGVQAQRFAAGRNRPGGSVASKRAPLRTTVICKKGDMQFESTSRNISESGMLLAVPGPVEVGEELELEFCIPHVFEPLKPRVQVIHKEPRGIGVRFVTLTLEARETSGVSPVRESRRP